MWRTRRTFLTGAATAGTALLTRKALGRSTPGMSAQRILDLFKPLPGDIAVKIYAPAANSKPEFLVESNSSKRMFVGSAIKTFVLCEALRQADSPDVVKILSNQQLELNASVWSADSATFNPPNLIGRVSERTAIEAMILHSDNTGTDMSLKHVGPDKIRKFIASIGLKNTLIPDSTRIFFGYILGAKDYKTFTWDKLAATPDNASFAYSPLNNVETLASSADDFISYYSRALQGVFFKHDQTLNEFRRVLAMGDAISLLPLPLGVSAFCKGGSVDVPGFHAICVPGAMLFDDRWVYFCLAINWYAAGATDNNTVNAFLSAANRALTSVKNTLSTCG
jgi:beta-lactamase class A